MKIGCYSQNYKYNSQTSPSFKGYDARRVTIALTQPGYGHKILQELTEIGEKHGIEVQISTGKKLRPLSYIEEIIQEAPKKLEEMAKKAEEQWKELEEKLKNSPLQIKLIRKEGGKEVQRRGHVVTKHTTYWAQDIATVTPNGNVLGDAENYGLAANIAFEHGRKFTPVKDHIKGGNLFFIKNKDGSEELLVGRADRKKLFKFCEKTIDFERLQRLYGVKKVIFLPQMDFHIDLAIRPLDNKRVLITDDSLSLEMLDKGIQKLRTALKKTQDIEKRKKYEEVLKRMEIGYSSFEMELQKTSNTPFQKTMKILKASGYEPIRVPGRLFSQSKFDDHKKHVMNYMNGIIAINDRNELVYITNKAMYDKNLGLTPEIAEEIGFNTEKAFKESISKYVKPENVFFIEGAFEEIPNSLLKKFGGIHCLSTEIPVKN